MSAHKLANFAGRPGARCTAGRSKLQGLRHLHRSLHTVNVEILACRKFGDFVQNYKIAKLKNSNIKKITSLHFKLDRRDSNSWTRQAM